MDTLEEHLENIALASADISKYIKDKKMKPKPGQKMAPDANDKNNTQFKKKAKADMGYVEDDCDSFATPDDVAYLSMRIDSLRDSLNYLSDSFYNHVNNGHLPPIIGASAMKQALKALGLQDDYQVQPQIVYASDGSREAVLLKLKKS